MSYLVKKSKLKTKVLRIKSISKLPAVLPPRRMLATEYSSSPAEEEISEPYIASTNYTVILIIIIPVLNVWNSSGLDVMDSPLNCFYQRFVTYLVWRSLKRPVQVTLYNHVLAWCHLISTKDNWMSEVLGTQQCFIVVSVKQHLGGRLVW